MTWKTHMLRKNTYDGRKNLRTCSIWVQTSHTRRIEYGNDRQDSLDSKSYMRSQRSIVKTGNLRRKKKYRGLNKGLKMDKESR